MQGTDHIWVSVFLKRREWSGFSQTERPIKMAEMYVFCYPASSAPAAADSKRERGQSREVTELSATNSLFIDFSKFGLG